MDIQAIGPQALLVLTSGAELLRWGVDPEQPDERALSRLAREALRREGLERQRLTELRFLTAPGSLLLLLRLSAAAAEWFPFPDLARAAEAIAMLPQPPEGPLVWQGQRYLLRESAPARRARLAEYTSPVSPDAAEEVERTATLVLDRGALARLWDALRR